MRIELPDDDSVEIPITPLIDVVFLLLIFFLVASQFKEVRHELRLNLPEASSAAEVVMPEDLFIIAIDRDGKVYIGNQPVETPTLTEQIRARAERQPDLRVRIDADRDTPYHHVISVLNELRFHGFTRVGLQTQAR